MATLLKHGILLGQVVHMWWPSENAGYLGGSLKRSARAVQLFGRLAEIPYVAIGVLVDACLATQAKTFFHVSSRTLCSSLIEKNWTAYYRAWLVSN
jgi:hypothetical protein